ncbi:Z1 domain-containing protein [Mesorhizobium sp. M0048]|uniref:Z1 domain-containing protein n=1 Tax=Mesorhizobium sp. M0048 TaxID=2956860 RepID=UPI00333DB600
MIILLAGTRVGLWLQTYERLLGQLDGSTPANAFRRRASRLILPQPDDVLNEQRADPARYLQRPLARQALRARRPIICVVPKEDDHLLMLRRFLLEVLSDEHLSARETPFTMLLLDDEADDASVLDSAGSQKITPRLITALWSGDPDLSESRNEKLRATYVAYTATPQANYLQATHNPLTPRDFNAALRTPGATGSADVRSLTFTEPSGVEGYYCGGEMFYERSCDIPSASLCLSTAFPELMSGETQPELALRRETLRWRMLSDALRSFMVGAAVRLHHSQNRPRYDRASIFDDAAAARAAAPPPHTMLLHPSARKDDHFIAAADVIRWSMSLPGEERTTSIPGEETGQPKFVLSPEGLIRRLNAEEAEWREWLDRFEASRIALSTLPAAPYPSILASDWPSIRSLLMEEIFPNVMLRVLNSDPVSDDRPRFEPEASDGGFRLAPDLLSIFVAGNVLSRGLTLEGLATSLFLRGATEPAADTQMQMQRWFGYRGPLLPFCRVMTFDDQLQLFKRYHVNDNALKSEILRKMDGGGNGASAAVLVLQGANFVATSKVESRKVPLSPGPRPSIRIVEAKDSTLARLNIDLVARLLTHGSWTPLKDANGLQRGLIREQPVGLLALADILDGLRYAHHDPDLASELSLRWQHYEALLGIDTPLLRPPGLHPQAYGCEPQSCPYSIAAYLRLWHALRGDRHAAGFYPTDRIEVPWSFADASQSREPRFYLAVRNGEHNPRDARLSQHGVRAMTRQLTDDRRSVQTLWGTRGYSGSYLGDELVDYYHHRANPIPSIQGGASWRPRGHPGLALIHVITDPHAPQDLVAVGLGLPHGGPDHIAALRA